MEAQRQFGYSAFPNPVDLLAPTGEGLHASQSICTKVPGPVFNKDASDREWEFSLPAVLPMMAQAPLALI